MTHVHYKYFYGFRIAFRNSTGCELQMRPQMEILRGNTSHSPRVATHFAALRTLLTPGA
jgi:hypothetical protein